METITISDHENYYIHFLNMRKTKIKKLYDIQLLKEIFMTRKLKQIFILVILTLTTSSCGSSYVREQPKEFYDILKNSTVKGDVPFLEPSTDKIVPCENGIIQVYKFQIRNLTFAPGTELAIYTRNCAGEVSKMMDAFVHTNGVVYVIDSQKNIYPFEEYRLAVGSYSPGESTDFILATQDLKIGASAHFVVHPLEVYSNNGTRISLEQRFPHGMFYEVYGSGYEPNEELITTSKSEQEEMKTQCFADDKGEIHHMLMPFVKGVKNGKGSFTLTRKNGESLTVDYPWGPDNTKPYLLPYASDQS